ncbi:hypothetical protein LTR36_003856 [Oleoguttula mirabilis]|uniref:DUF924-domain-containing protein n=1 Tax=Oleoguttula mirabilis TaxID=1507867 RepID=A0AAV9JI61_9PEZI|nr:hypothetical protein LTR36_003856 [Oleoguttula mirabilis]
MLLKAGIRRALVLNFATFRMRSFSAMVTPPQSFQLDRSIFNQSLYSELRNVWFDNLEANTTAPTVAELKRWWGLGSTAEEKAAFDGECRSLFGLALESIGPSKLSLPPFKSYEEDIENAETIAAPFLTEVRNAQREDQKKGADTLLSLILLLDQMTRNIFRDQEGLRLVYGHYDRLAFSLLRGSMALQPSPVRHSSWTGLSTVQPWLAMPLIHAEHLPSLELQAEMIAELRQECVQDEAALRYAAGAAQANGEHLSPLALFGRYPHRNGALDRQSTPEEEEYLKTAKTFGVKQAEERESKDEL